MKRSPFDATDPFSAVLHRARITGSFYCRSELTAPWGLYMPPFEGCMWFHAVTEGQCLIEVDGADPVTVGAGGFALVPHGRGHRLRSARRVAAPNVVELPQDMVGEHYSLLRYGGGGASTILICGVVRMEPPAGAELERMLPPILHLDAAAIPHGEWMDSTLRMIAQESRSLRPGGETVLTRLADVLVIQAIRTWLERDPVARTGWLGALRDPQIGQALQRMWRAPNDPWTVATLAERAAMSRSSFAQRFTTLVGETPMAHLARVRMQLASIALRERKATVGALAAELGYQSQAAFARAFKRVIGTSPGALKRGVPIAATAS